MAHDQATIQELKSMFSELKELLHQQVTCSVPQSCVCVVWVTPDEI